MPGVGKSTLVAALIGHYRAAGAQVGVVAVDPSSPFSGGALLGDRVRMQHHATDAGVFIRSLATRGQLGGLSRSTVDVVSVLDAAGFERIIVETVGVGQAEVDVMSAVDVVVVVSAPGLGDEVQALKAGILEIADVLVVNKADREGADRAVKDLTTMLDLAQRGRGGAPRGAAGGARPVLKTVASSGVGIEPLAQAIDGARPATPEQRADRRRQQAEAQVLAIAGELGRQALRRLVGARGNDGGDDADADHADADGGGGGGGRSGAFRRLVDEVAARRCDPYAAAAALVDALAAARS